MQILSHIKYKIMSQIYNIIDKKSNICIKNVTNFYLLNKICEEVGVSRATYYRYLREQGVEGIRNYERLSL